MNPQEIMDQIKMNRIALTKGNDELRTLGIKKANAERKYKIELRKELLKLRLEKFPIAIVQDLAKGEEKISLLRLERDLVENAYTVCQEGMRNARLEQEVLRSLLTWQRIELGNS